MEILKDTIVFMFIFGAVLFLLCCLIAEMTSDERKRILKLERKVKKLEDLLKKDLVELKKTIGENRTPSAPEFPKDKIGYKN